MNALSYLDIGCFDRIVMHLRPNPRSVQALSCTCKQVRRRIMDCARFADLAAKISQFYQVVATTSNLGVTLGFALKHFDVILVGENHLIDAERKTFVNFVNAIWDQQRHVLLTEGVPSMPDTTPVQLNSDARSKIACWDLSPFEKKHFLSETLLDNAYILAKSILLAHDAVQPEAFHSSYHNLLTLLDTFALQTNVSLPDTLTNQFKSLVHYDDVVSFSMARLHLLAETYPLVRTGIRNLLDKKNEEMTQKESPLRDRQFIRTIKKFNSQKKRIIAFSGAHHNRADGLVVQYLRTSRLSFLSLKGHLAHKYTRNAFPDTHLPIEEKRARILQYSGKEMLYNQYYFFFYSNILDVLDHDHAEISRSSNSKVNV